MNKEWNTPNMEYLDVRKTESDTEGLNLLHQEEGTNGRGMQPNAHGSKTST